MSNLVTPRKKAAVISGGGSFGACGLGTLTALNQSYDIIAGVSTGSLMAPLVALGEWDRLKYAYTHVSQKDIFTFNPFTKSGKVHVLKAIWRLVSSNPTLGDSTALRRTIDHFITDEDFARVNSLGKEVIVATQETSREPSRVHHFSTKQEAANDFRDWMWASANSPIAMSLLYKNGGEWTDGGVTELLSLFKVIAMGARDIDVIIHRARPESKQNGPVKNLVHNFMRLFSIMRKEIENNDLEIGLAAAEAFGCKVNVYWLPLKLADNSLLFDEATMEAWWHFGYDTAFDEDRIDRYDFTDSLRHAA